MIGGSNAHVILEESPFIQRQRSNHLTNGKSHGSQEVTNEIEPYTNVVWEEEAIYNAAQVPPRLFLLTANDTKSLDHQAIRLKEYLSSCLDRKDDSLSDLAFTLGQRRSLLPCKATYVAESPARLIQKLEKPDLAPLRSTKVPQLGYVFTGQGAQWHGMGRELLTSCSVFASAIEAAANYLLKVGASFSLRDEIRKDPISSRLGQAAISQPACTAIQIALVLMLRSWGERPTTVTGHSSGACERIRERVHGEARLDLRSTSCGRQ